MQSNALPALFLRAIARGADGQYSDIEAREALADLAGELFDNLHWVDGMIPALSAVTGTYQTGRWMVDKSRSSNLVWDIYERLAPLVSLDAANAVAMPVGWDWERSGGDEPKFYSLIRRAPDGRWEPVEGDNFASVTFEFTDDESEKVAYLTCRCYAHLRSKEAA